MSEKVLKNSSNTEITKIETRILMYLQKGCSTSFEIAFVLDISYDGIRRHLMNLSRLGLISQRSILTKSYQNIYFLSFKGEAYISNYT